MCRYIDDVASIYIYIYTISTTDDEGYNFLFYIWNYGFVSCSKGIDDNKCKQRVTFV